MFSAQCQTDAVTKIEVSNPATGAIVGHVDNSSLEDCLTAVDRAHDAFTTWRRVLPRQRAEMLRPSYDLIMAEQKALATLIVQENGKVLSAAMAEVA